MIFNKKYKGNKPIIMKMTKRGMLLLTLLLITIAGCSSNAKLLVKIDSDITDKRIALADINQSTIDIQEYTPQIIEFNHKPGNYTVLLTDDNGVPIIVSDINVKKGINTILFYRSTEDTSIKNAFKESILNENISFIKENTTQDTSWKLVYGSISKEDYKKIKKETTESFIEKTINKIKILKKS